MRVAASFVGVCSLVLALGCSADTGDAVENGLDEGVATGTAEEAPDDERVASSESALRRANSGTIAWARALFESPSFLGSDGGGNAYAAGIQYVNGVRRTFVLKYSPTGFRTKFDFPVESLSAFGVASDGTLAFSGYLDTYDSADFGCGAVPRFHHYVAVVRADRSCAWTTAASGPVRARSLAFGPSGEVVTSGIASGTYDLGDGVERSSLPLVYLSRFTAGGAHHWSKVFGDAESTTSSNQVPTGADVDGSGRIHLLGRFRQTIDFGGGTLTAASGSNFEFATGFLASFTSAGTYLRARTFGTSVSPSTIDAAPDGSVVIGGRFGGNVEFDAKSLSNPSATRDIFLATFNPDGGVRWVKKLWGTASMKLVGAAFDYAGYVGVVGQFEKNSSAVRSLHVGSFEFFTDDDTRMFTAQFTPRYGTTVWAHEYSAAYPSAPGAVLPRAFAITPNNGRLLVTGEVRGVTEFDGAPFGTTTSPTPFLLRIYP